MKAVKVARRTRELNGPMREGIARRQARYMQMFEEDDWKKIDRAIQDQGNDYYRTDLFPDRPTMVEAIDDFETYRTGTPAMERVADDMRRYYGLNKSQPIQPAPVATPVPVPVKPNVAPQEFKEKAVEEVKQVMPQEVQEKKVKINMKDAALLGGGLATGAAVGAMLNRPSEEDPDLLVRYA